MPKQTEIHKFELSASQANALLNAIVEIEDLFAHCQSKDILEANWKNLGDKMHNKKLVSDKSIFYDIYNGMKNHKDEFTRVPFKTIEVFLKTHFSKVFEIDYNGEYGNKIVEVVNKSPLAKEGNDKLVESIYETLSNHDWWLYTFGEKSLNLKKDSVGIAPSKRIFYVKERPVQFTGKGGEKRQITIVNSDDLVTFKQYKYEGPYNVFTKPKAQKSYIYLETKALEGENDRHLRIMLSFGESIDEIGLGTFSGIRDGGALFAGTALLVKGAKGDFQKGKCTFYDSFTEKPLKAAIRMILERRGKAFIKLPSELDTYTLSGLKTYLLKQRVDERTNWETRDVHVYRMNAFISIPLFYSSTPSSVFENHKAILLHTQQYLQDNYSLPTITHGIIKHLEIEKETIPNNFNVFDTNFDHITQSNFFIQLLPNIEFPYNDDKIRLSTAFLELGFAWGLRKKILIICTQKMFEALPKSIAQFNGQKVRIIIGNISNVESLQKVLEVNKDSLSSFFNEK